MPEGFNIYQVIVGPNGQVLAPASCWVVDVDVFSEETLRADIERGERTLNEIMRQRGARDLAPELKRARR